MTTTLPAGRYRSVRARRGVMLHGVKMMRAPQGYTKEKPLVINGKPYIGGQVIPNHELDKLSSEEKQKLEGQAQQAKGGAQGQPQQKQEQQPTQPKIETSPGASDIAKDLFPGKEHLPPEALFQLIGSPEGEVHIAAQRGIRGTRVHFSVKSDKISEMTRTLEKAPNGKLLMRNNVFKLSPDEQGKGYGVQVFAKQVQACLDAGVGAIVCHAGKDLSSKPEHQMNGYTTWPKLGYDAPLGEFKDNLPEHLQGADTVLDLYDKPGGQEWWYDHGDELKMAFDLTPGSRSLQVLNQYLEKKGQPLIANRKAEIATGQ